MFYAKPLAIVHFIFHEKKGTGKKRIIRWREKKFLSKFLQK